GTLSVILQIADKINPKTLKILFKIIISNYNKFKYTRYERRRYGEEDRSEEDTVKKIRRRRYDEEDTAKKIQQRRYSKEDTVIKIRLQRYWFVLELS
ncbi:23100_t:CDS:1, partial [Cetraspora pellucida]